MPASVLAVALGMQTAKARSGDTSTSWWTTQKSLEIIILSPGQTVLVGQEMLQSKTINQASSKVKSIVSQKLGVEHF
jgi:hypothetical protein